MAALTLKTLNQLPTDAFVDALREVYEHSPWVIRSVAGRRPFGSRAALHAACESALLAAEEAAQRALIEAHPDLAAKIERLQELTDFSREEQSRAGFAGLPEATLGELREALGEYRERFGHPFILCVSDFPAADVLPILRVRLTARPEVERLTCLFQIARIGWHRICTLCPAD
jgi:2-oxo-4-hydroxy-4-carboxy-5-ureidoimidazoline decarboxylase